jgi:molybdopterin-guanine dinucleotide biosynthesis adapter protein
MKICGFFGESGGGKTTLIESLLPALREQGLRVSVIKHAHAGFDIDRPGKDSHRHREAGAFEVLVTSGQRLALLREFEVQGQPKVHALVRELTPCDWVLVEGYGQADIPKIEVLRGGSERRPLYPDDPFVMGLVIDEPERLPEPTMRPVWARGEAALAGVLALLLENSNQRFDYDPARYL